MLKPHFLDQSCTTGHTRGVSCRYLEIFYITKENEMFFLLVNLLKLYITIKGMPLTEFWLSFSTQHCLCSDKGSFKTSKQKRCHHLFCESARVMLRPALRYGSAEFRRYTRENKAHAIGTSAMTQKDFLDCNKLFAFNL